MISARTIANAGWTACLTGTLLLAYAIVAPAQAQTRSTPAKSTVPKIAAQPVIELDDVIEDKPGDEDVSFDAVDLSQLSDDITLPAKPAPRRAGPANTEIRNDWARTDKANGSAAVTVRRNLTPFLDTKIGADLDVATLASPSTTDNPLPERLVSEQHASRSGGSAWASLTAPGLILWDKTAVEARVDPGEEQGRLKTSLSKSLPLWDNQFSLTLRNDYSLTQHSMPGMETTVTRNVDVDRSAKLGVNASGTSLIAGQSMSSANERWLHRFGAEQKLLDGVSVTATISQTNEGPANKGIAAAFKKTW